MNPPPEARKSVEDQLLSLVKGCYKPLPAPPDSSARHLLGLLHTLRLQIISHSSLP